VFLLTLDGILLCLDIVHNPTALKEETI